MERTYRIAIKEGIEILIKANNLKEAFEKADGLKLTNQQLKQLQANGAIKFTENEIKEEKKMVKEIRDNKVIYADEIRFEDLEFYGDAEPMQPHNPDNTEWGQAVTYKGKEYQAIFNFEEGEELVFTEKHFDRLEKAEINLRAKIETFNKRMLIETRIKTINQLLINADGEEERKNLAGELKKAYEELLGI